jgi:hypothetical protein
MARGARTQLAAGAVVAEAARPTISRRGELIMKPVPHRAPSKGSDEGLAGGLFPPGVDHRLGPRSPILTPDAMGVPDPLERSSPT